jgi:hypothetical protein
VDALELAAQLISTKPSKQRRTCQRNQDHIISCPTLTRLDVKKDGATRSSGHFDKKQDAVDAGARSARTKAPSFYIHGKDGRSRTRTATERSVSAEGVMSGSIRFPFWELNRRPKTGFEVVAEKPQVIRFTANPSPSSGAGNPGEIVSLVGLAEVVV